MSEDRLSIPNRRKRRRMSTKTRSIKREMGRTIAKIRELDAAILEEEEGDEGKPFPVSSSDDVTVSSDDDDVIVSSDDEVTVSSEDLTVSSEDLTVSSEERTESLCGKRKRKRGDS